jgi:hypothetical protein
MGPRPADKTSIDRVDSNGGYGPDNCRWADAIEQARNTSRNVRLLYKGRAQTLMEWCVELGFDTRRYYAIKSRLASGWSADRAFTEPVMSIKQGVKFSFNGLNMTLTEWSRHIGVGISTLQYRINNGFPPESVFTNKKFK